MEDKDLIKKCEVGNFNLDNDLIQGCKDVLENSKKHGKKLDISDDEVQTYLEMAENLKPKDVTKALELALKIQSSETIKDTELRNQASRLIRAINMS
ncbi:MAG: hypothetical protein LBB45_03425 [Methanobrevibacter sp.]|jgi:hypothetical protein|nr:hypothetical protein [Candidatus Methanovirga basalitermitum]